VIPEGVADLTNLRVLTLSNNEMTALPSGMTRLVLNLLALLVQKCKY
jgi:hypothetical protein